MLQKEEHLRFLHRVYRLVGQWLTSGLAGTVSGKEQTNKLLGFLEGVHEVKHTEVEERLDMVRVLCNEVDDDLIQPLPLDVDLNNEHTCA